GDGRAALDAPTLTRGAEVADALVVGDEEDDVRARGDRCRLACRAVSRTDSGHGAGGTAGAHALDQRAAGKHPWAVVRRVENCRGFAPRDPLRPLALRGPGRRRADEGGQDQEEGGAGGRQTGPHVPRAVLEGGGSGQRKSAAAGGCAPCRDGWPVGSGDGFSRETARQR